MIPTLDTATVGFDVPFATYLRIAANAGFRSIEFSIEHAKQFVREHSLPQLLSLSQQCELEFGQFSCGMGIPSNLSISAAGFEQALELWRINCAFAETLACRKASVLVNSAKGNHVESAGQLLPAAEVQRRLRLLCAIALKHGVMVSVEFVDANMIEAASEILRGVGAENLGLLLDTYGLHKISDPLSYTLNLPAGMLSWIHLADVHVEDYRQLSQGRKPRRMLPNQGAMPLHSLLTAARQRGYQGHISVEVYGSDIMPASSFQQRASLAAGSIFNGELQSFFQRA